jgi:hypothetical protein
LVPAVLKSPKGEWIHLIMFPHHHVRSLEACIVRPACEASDVARVCGRRQ